MSGQEPEGGRGPERGADVEPLAPLAYGTPSLMAPATRHGPEPAPGPPEPPSGPTGPGGSSPRPAQPTRRWVLGATGAVVAAANVGMIAKLIASDTSASAHSAHSAGPTPARPAHAAAARTPSATQARNLIQIENARLGTNQFAVRMEEPWVDMIHAWCDHDSAHQGDTVTIYATTEAPTFVAEAFRFGHYGGATGRRIWHASEPIAGVKQKPPTIDPATNMRSCAHWQPSLRVPITSAWTPGMYMFRLTGSDGGATFVPLTVLDRRRADLLVVSAITTWNAYNHYGGASLYDGEHGRSKVVTFDRPYDLSGSGHFFGGEYELVQQVESMGIDVAYTTNIDLHAHPEQIQDGGYKAVVTLAHDEYYSVPIRRGLEAARDRGVNLVFLGANAGFRRIRLEPSAHGPHRLEVNYRIPSEDPLYGHGDQELVTAEWRAGPSAHPEAALIGNYYESNPVLADMVVSRPDSWILAGTNLKAGATFKHMVQNEYDRVTPEVPGTPTNIEVVCHSPLTCHGHASYADVTYYTAPSGAGVFATGTLWWERQLGPVCTDAASSHSDQCHLRRMTANVLDAFVEGPAGARHPAVSNLGVLGIRAGYVADPPGHTDERSQ